MSSDPTARRKPAGPEEPGTFDSTIHVLERAQAGDRSAARILIERAVPALKRWAHGRIPSYGRGPADTEDVVQDAVMRTLRRAEAFEHRTVGALQAYLRLAVVNRIRDVVRQVRRRGVPEELPERLTDDAASPLEIAIMRERLDGFIEALQRLRPADRQLIVWRIELGYSSEEIGRRLGKSTEAAGMAVKRALDRLAREMAIDPRLA
jgi:RNA polymerase sigma-70 factor (ECF subfamily)